MKREVFHNSRANRGSIRGQLPICPVTGKVGTGPETTGNATPTLSSRLNSEPIIHSLPKSLLASQIFSVVCTEA